MNRGRRSGRYERITVGDEEVAAFIPRPLPPRDPILYVDGALAERLRAAEQALARLGVVAELTAAADWLLPAFVRKEAVLSTQLAGARATLEDLFAFEAQPSTSRSAAGPEVKAVLDHVDAFAVGRKELASHRGPLFSMRLLNGVHERLMRGARGAENVPGQARRSQTWVGGARPGNAAYVPPPPNALGELLTALDKYVHVPFGEGRGVEALPMLVRVGLVHAQFLTIHPYLDGNGRIGRLLVMLLLENWRLLKEPLLCASLFFKQRRDECERRLTAVRVDGEWEEWTAFFLEGIATVARDAVASARELLTLVAADRARLLEQEGMSLFALRLFELLPRYPVVTVAAVMKLVDTTKPTAGRAVELLEAAGVLAETTGKRRDRAYAYRRFLDLLCAGTELGLPVT
jgi:cell filamentation protein, protein adenylyltransferase